MQKMQHLKTSTQKKEGCLLAFMGPEVGAPRSRFKYTPLLVARASDWGFKIAPLRSSSETLTDGLLNTGLPEQGLETCHWRTSSS